MTAPFTDFMDFVTYPHEAWDEMQALYAKLAAAKAENARLREAANDLEGAASLLLGWCLARTPKAPSHVCDTTIKAIKAYRGATE